MNGPDHLDADRLSAPGGEPVLVVEAATWRRPEAPIQAVVIGVDRDGTLQTASLEDSDILATSAPAAPYPWVPLDTVERLVGAVRAHPFAATIAAQVLRLTSKLPVADALAVESLAYSSLLGGAEFSHWRSSAKSDALTPPPSYPVTVERDDDVLTLTLDDPENLNAMTAGMRDALYEALVNVLEDPSKPNVVLRGAGKCFSTGGALAEFGTAQDFAEAHAVRTLHSCARVLDALRERATVKLHGACVGSGIEIAAAAHRRIAAPDAWFQLPELAMGLIPGAGGTVTVARAIGRQRTLWMLLSGKRIGAAQAHAWGLIDAIEGRA